MKVHVAHVVGHLFHGMPYLAETLLKYMYSDSESEVVHVLNDYLFLSPF